MNINYSDLPSAHDRIDTVGAGTPGYTSPVHGEGFGWVAFATIVFMIGGVFNLVDGLVVISRSHYLASQDVLVGNLATWGWVFIIIGIVQMAVSAAIRRGAGWGKIVGIGLAAAAIVGQMLFMSTYPIWSLLIIAMDVIVIYGLVVYGGNPDTAPIAAP